jgi:hypothetical protein
MPWCAPLAFLPSSAVRRIPLTGRLGRALEAHGIGGTLALLPRLLGRRLRRLRPSARRKFRRARQLDRSLNIRTIGQVAMSTLQIESPNARLGVKYQPTPATDFATLMGRLHIDHSRFAFIDVGAGKGACLCLAAAYPFREIVGVEFSSALSDLARQNLATLRLPQRRCHEARVVCLDAAEFVFPPVPSVIYLFNPFLQPVMSRVLENLIDSLHADPRPLFVVYYNASHRALFDRSPHFEVVETLGPPLLAEPSAIFRARL